MKQVLQSGSLRTEMADSAAEHRLQVVMLAADAAEVLSTAMVMAEMPRFSQEDFREDQLGTVKDTRLPRRQEQQCCSIARISLCSVRLDSARQEVLFNRSWKSGAGVAGLISTTTLRQDLSPLEPMVF